MQNILIIHSMQLTRSLNFLKDVLASCVSTLVAVSRSCTWEFVDHMLGSDSKVIKQLVKIVDNGKHLFYCTLVSIIQRYLLSSICNSARCNINDV